MIRSRMVKVSAILATTAALAFVGVVSTSSHETELQDEDRQLADGPGPEPSRPVPVPKSLVGLEIALGLKDTKPTDWVGEVTVSEGRVESVEVVRAGPNAKTEGSKFSLVTPKAKAAAKKKKKAQQEAKAKAKQDQQQAKKKQAAPLGVTLRANVDAPPGATVKVHTNAGDFDFVLSDLAAGQRKLFLDGQAAAERQAAAVRLTGPDTEDDYPVSATAPDGTVWLANVEYRPEVPRPFVGISADEFDKLVPTKNGDQIKLRRFDGQAWLPPIDVTGPRQDVWRPTVAVDGKGNVVVAWAEPVDGDWEIVRRTYTPPSKANGEGTWSKPARVTRAPGSDFHVVAATDSQGVVWLAWQGWRTDNYEILLAAIEPGHRFEEPRVISDSPANDWGPAIAASPKGGVHVAWDTYDKGNYDVLLRSFPDDARTRTVAGSPRFEGRPHLACDRAGRVWIAYEEGDEQWGKDYAHAGPVANVGLEKNPGFALYVNRTVRVKCLADGKLQQTAGALDAAFKGQPERNKSVPRLGVDADGAVWLAYRHHPGAGGGEVWIGAVTRYDGKAWAPARRLAASSNIIDNRPALAALSGGGMLAVHSSDSRQSTQNRKQDDLYCTRLVADGTTEAEPTLAADGPAPKAELATVHPNESADVARMRGYRVEAGGKTLRLLRGEFHRHTEFSSHNDQDGLLEDAWRYALDAGDLDWMGDGDHDNGFGHEYMWWLVQKITDLHHNPPRFVPAQTYERSVVYPNGHRNVMMPKRGIRPLPRGTLPGTAAAGSPDTKLLYQYLKHFGGICASHTSATNMGTDWRDNDPVVEPIVEIYQGHRHNYEHFGAPKSATEKTQIGGYEPAGFVWNALEKGYKLGFQSSSDHVSTHISYAVVLADEATRPALIEAFKKRHCYAATDNIVLDVRSGDHLMGDTFETKDRPSLSIAVHGTAAVSKLHVVRDNKYVMTVEPDKTEVKVRYTDDDAKPGESHFYYVRVEQSDRNLAWGSPMWVTYKE